MLLCDGDVSGDTGHMSDVDTLREPQRHAAVRRGARPRPATLAAPGRSRCGPRWPGRGGSWTSTSSWPSPSPTALVVVVDGVLVHEQYFHGTGAGDRLLGFSATKSALALLVGQAMDDGRLPRARYPRDRPGSRAGPQRVRRGEPAPAAHHDQRRRMARGLPRPGSPASQTAAAGGALARAGCGSHCWRSRRATRRAAGTPTARRTPWSWTGRGSGRPASPSRRRWPRCGRRSRRSGRPWSGWTSRRAGGVAMAGGSLAATARDWARHRHAADRRPLAGPAGGQPVLG